MEKDDGAEGALAEDLLGGEVLFAESEGSLMLFDKCCIANTLNDFFPMNLYEKVILVFEV